MGHTCTSHNLPSNPKQDKSRKQKRKYSKPKNYSVRRNTNKTLSLSLSLLLDIETGFVHSHLPVCVFEFITKLYKVFPLNYLCGRLHTTVFFLVYCLESGIIVEKVAMFWEASNSRSSSFSSSFALQIFVSLFCFASLFLCFSHTVLTCLRTVAILNIIQHSREFVFASRQSLCSLSFTVLHTKFIDNCTVHYCLAALHPHCNVILFFSLILWLSHTWTVILWKMKDVYSCVSIALNNVCSMICSGCVIHSKCYSSTTKHFTVHLLSLQFRRLFLAFLSLSLYHNVFWCSIHQFIHITHLGDSSLLVIHSIFRLEFNGNAIIFFSFF